MTISTSTILKMLTYPVLVVDHTYRAVMANPAFYDLLQISPGDLEGQSVQALIDGKDSPRHLRAVLESIVPLEGQAKELELELDGPSGVRKVVSVSAKNISEGECEDRLVLVEMRDITGEKDAARKLGEMNEILVRHSAEVEQINTDLQSFNRWVSHDLRTPLRFMNTITHQLLKEHQGELPADVEESVYMIMDSTREMGKLVENLLAFARLGRAPIELRRCDMFGLARETIAELEADQPGSADAFGVDALPPCQADGSLMKQVLMNLFGNALKFTEACEQPEIQVGFTQDNDTTAYFVRDNGAGFRPDQADMIFSPLQGAKMSHPLQGAGVGLTLVKRIIERHGGRIWAEGALGKGATFYFQVGQ